MPAKTNTSPLLQDGSYTVSKVIELNSFDLTGERNKTKNTSNKSYHAELQIAKTGQKAQIYTMWGATGGHQTKDWRHYTSHAAAEKDFESIIKSKKKKGYVEIDISQRALGSEEAKQITKPVALTNTGHLNIAKSALHKETQRLISTLMGATNNFVVQTLKCPLGQLSNQQIDLGRDILNKAKQEINLKKPDENKLLDLTNQFYAAIPHNLGSGVRGKMVELLINNVNRVAELDDELDTLLDAKQIGAVLSAGSKVDDQYNSLNTDMVYIDKNSKLFEWLNRMMLETRANNHHFLGKIKLLNAWSVTRNKERDDFLNIVEEIAKTSTRTSLPRAMKDLIPIRPDLDDMCKLYPKTNTWPLFHGTRTQNITGILKSGLLIRPAGVVLCGSMYGNGVYFSAQNSKSINYTSINNSYWSRGNDNTAYLFLNDIVMGDPFIASNAYNYTPKNILPKHSVWAVGGRSGVINDEMIVYNTKQINQRYLLEFTCA